MPLQQDTSAQQENTNNKLPQNNSSITTSSPNNTEASAVDSSQWLHHALPNIGDAKQKYEAVTSDHIPVLLTVPWTEAGEGKELKIISWNVLEDDAYSGFGQEDSRYRVFGESETQTIERHQRIAAGLEKCVTNNAGVDFILLQEISKDGELLKKIKNELPPDWEMASAENGNVILYNKLKFQLPENTQENNSASYKDLKKSLTASFANFTSKENPEQSIEILTVHVPFNKNPETTHENQIKPFLNAAPVNTKRIVVGDFNCTIVPLDTEPMNLTTSVSPGYFNVDNLQLAWVIDGGYYSKHDGETVSRQQAQTSRLNPTTGQIDTKNNLPLLEKNTPEQRDARQFRAGMAIESYYDQAKLIADQTIFEYQNKLRKELNDNLLVVRPGINCNNERAMSIYIPCGMKGFIQFNNKLGFQFLKELKQPAFQFTSLTSEEQAEKLAYKGICADEYFQISSPTGYVSHLERAMNFYVALGQFQQELVSKESTDNYKVPQLQKLYQNTQELLGNITNNTTTVQQKLEFLEKYAKQQNDIINSPKNAITQNAIQLGKALGMLLVAALVVIACTGIGAVIGGVCTAGFGSGAGAILGAIKGAKIAVTLGLIGGSVLGGIAGGAVIVKGADRFFKPEPKPEHEPSPQLLQPLINSIIDNAKNLIEGNIVSSAEDVSTLASITNPKILICAS